MGVLDGQIAIVSGAASGIGSAIVDAYLAEGARVVLADNDVDALAAAVERSSVTRGVVSSDQVDVSDPEQTKVMVEQCVDTFGQIWRCAEDGSVALASIITDLAVTDVTDDGLMLVECAPSVSHAEVRAATEPPGQIGSRFREPA